MERGHQKKGTDLWVMAKAGQSGRNMQPTIKLSMQPSARPSNKPIRLLIHSYNVNSNPNIRSTATLTLGQQQL